LSHNSVFESGCGIFTLPRRSTTEQIVQIKADIERFKTDLSPNTDPDKLAQEVVTLARQIAFAPGSEEPTRAAEALNTLLRNNPGSDQMMLSRLLVNAANNATNSSDFTQNTNGFSNKDHGDAETVIWDRRLASPFNRAGRIASVAGYSDSASQKAADLALRAAEEYRRAMSNLPDSSQDEFRRHEGSISAWLHFIQD
jgi:hypothetical protein